MLITLGNKLFFQDDTSNPEINDIIVNTESKPQQNNKDTKDVFDTNTSNTENVAQEDSNKDDVEELSNKTQESTTVNKNESVIAKNKKSAPSKNTNVLKHRMILTI